MMITKVAPQVAFGKVNFCLDVGASDSEGRGSAKPEVRAYDGTPIEDLQTMRATVFKTGEDERNEPAFEENIAEIIAGTIAANKDAIKECDTKDTKGKKGQVDIVVAYPGPTHAMKYGRKNSNGPLLTNFRYNTGEHSGERFEKPINGARIDSLIAGLLVQKGIDFKVGKTRHVNDMAAGGASVAKDLAENHPEVLKDGRKILYLYPGGGLGSGEILVDSTNIKIMPTEKQHTYGTVQKSNSEYGIEHIEKNVQIEGLKRNFALAAFPGKNQAALRKAVMGSEGKVMDNYKAFNANEKLAGTLTPEQHAKASHGAIMLYMESLSQVVARQIADAKTDTVVITGKIANGISKSVPKNPYFDGKTFADVLKEKTYDALPDVGQKLLGEKKEEFCARLNVILMPLENNNEGAYLLADSRQVGNPPGWYNIPKKKLGLTKKDAKAPPIKWVIG